MVSITNIPLPLKGRTLTTTLIFPPPPAVAILSISLANYPSDATARRKTASILSTLELLVDRIEKGTCEDVQRTSKHRASVVRHQIWRMTRRVLGCVAESPQRSLR